MNSQHRVVSSVLKINDETRKVDKYYILKETQNFNDSKFSEDNSRCVLVELIYLLNSGTQFDDQEIETIFFRITKLFQSNNPKLRQIIYKALKMTMPYKYVHMLIQCITKDLMSDDQQIRLLALKFIPYLQNEQYIEQIEKIIQNAFLETNLLISSAALIIGIHLINRYPNIVGKWLFEVIQRLGQTKQNLQYHALILLYEIKRTNLSQFIKILNQMINEQQQQLVQLQIIRFLEVILPYLSNQQKQPLINYLLEMANKEDRMLRFQQISALVKTLDVQNQALQPIILNLQKEFVQRLTFNRDRNHLPQREGLLTNFILIYTKAMAFSSSPAISCKTFQLCIQIYGKRALNEFKVLFQKVIIEYQHNCLVGLFELINANHSYGTFVLDFISETNIPLVDPSLFKITAQIIKRLLAIPQHIYENKVWVESFKKTIQQDQELRFQFIQSRVLNNAQQQYDQFQWQWLP